MNSKKTEMLELGRRTFLAQATGAAGLLVGTGLNGSFNILRAAKTDAAGATANTVYGKLKGGAQGGGAQGKTLAFKGIPYGASTEGAGRFQPPTKPASWTGVREALELGPASPQVPSTLIPESMAQQPKGDANGSEDCLHLNVWTNSLKGNRPVMVWFHGGGYSA